MGISELLVDLIENSFTFYLYDNATFYAERLYYENPTNDHLNILAQCYFRQNKIKQVYLLLKNVDNSISRYLFSLACLSLKKFEEAEASLLFHQESNSSPKIVPGGAAGLYLLGVICRKGHRKEKAINYFQESLKLDPTLWSSIVELSELGVPIDSQELYPVEPQLLDNIKQIKSSRNASPTILPSKSTEKSTKPSKPSSSSKKNSNLKMESKHLSSLDRRKLVESTYDPLSHHNNPSLSLGSSSIAMRIPFTSPGSITSKIPNTVLKYSQSSYTSPIADRTRSFIDSKQNDDDDGQPRKLFEMSHSTITPYMKSFTLNDSSLFQSSVHEINKGRNNHLPPKTGINPSTVRYPQSQIYNSHLNQPSEDLTNNSYPGVADNYMHIESQISNKNDGGNRRVSFGPTARLSFSSMGGESMDVDTFEYQLKFKSQLQSNNPKNSSNSTVDLNSHSRYQISDIQSDIINDDDYPQKVFRMSSNLLIGNETRISNPNPNISPIASSLATDSPDPNYQTFDVTSIDTDKKRFNSNLKSNQNIHPNPQDFNPSIPTKPSHLLPVNNRILENDIVRNVISPDSWKLYCRFMHIFSQGYQLLNFYECVACVEVLKLLPKSHFFTGTVYHWIGRAYYEICDYRSSLLSLKEMIKLEPYRVKGTEILSTVLWHLKKEKELAALSQQMVELDKFAPETWCVVGNCFSLQKEHDVALRFFQRALQLDPSYTYAHTLCGHELVNNEDLEKASSSFRLAIMNDERHYNAWYGLGSVYCRQEKYALAEHHFRRALNINNASSVLKCFLSIVLHSQSLCRDTGETGIDVSEKSKEALAILDEAISCDPRNPQLRFQRAHVLHALVMQAETTGAQVLNKSSARVVTLEGRTREEVLCDAAEDLLRVREVAPNEPPVHVMLGQICQKLGRTLEAIQHYNAAIDLDPKEAAGLKITLESL